MADYSAELFGASDQKPDYAQELFGIRSEVSQSQKQAPIDREAIARQVLAETPWAERQLAAAGGVLSKAWSGLTGQDVPQDEQTYTRVAAQEAPVGAITGEVARFAPAFLAPAAILPQMAVAGTIGAATTPGDVGERIQSGAFEAGAAGAGGLAFKGIEKIASQMSPLDRARQALQKILGGQTAQAQQLAEQAVASGRPVTTAQALVDLQNPTLAALASQMRGRAGTGAGAAESALYYQGMDLAQDAARRDLLNRMAGGATAEQAARTREGMRGGLERALGPMRENAMVGANVGGDVVNPALARASQLEQEALMFGGTSAEAARLRDLAAGVEGLGFRPLDVSAITGRITQMLDDPRYGPSKNVSNVLSEAAAQINDWVRRNAGTIDADALYTLRKTAINETVDRLLAGANPVASKQLAAKLSGELKPLIDDAIEAAGGQGWKEYIQRYSRGLETIDRRELLDVARQLYSDNPKAFMDLVKGESPEMVQKIMAGKKGIEDALSPATLDRLRGVAGELERDTRLAALTSGQAGTSGANALNQIIKEQEYGKIIPNLLLRWAVLMNKATELGEVKMSRALYGNLNKAMRDPSAFLELVNALPVRYRNDLIGAMSSMRQAGVPQVGSAAMAGYAQE